MLVPSDRHTREDLQIWKNLESVDCLRSMHAKVRRSLGVVSDFCSKGPCYCSVSWGKDSVVIASLVHQVSPETPMVWVRPAGAEMPGCEEVRDEFLRNFPEADYRECETEASVWNDQSVSNEKAFLPARIAAGTRRRIVGVRASESATRTMSMRYHGLATDEVCRPIGWWDVEDVFAFLAQNRLPVHPAYAMLGGGRYERNHRRVASLGGEWGNQFGRSEWEYEYYSDVINRIKHAAS